MSAAVAVHYSGILVICHPEDLEGAARRVHALQGAEVHMRDERAGRLIAVLESDDVQGQERLLERVRQVPGVAEAALVYHYVDRREGREIPGADGGEA